MKQILREDDNKKGKYEKGPTNVDPFLKRNERKRSYWFL